MPEPSGGAETLEYRTEVKQLLDILAHSLYTDREIFLRELISNASGRAQSRAVRDADDAGCGGPGTGLAIHLSVDAEAQTITIADSGIGMNREELAENLGTIAHSGRALSCKMWVRVKTHWRRSSANSAWVSTRRLWRPLK